MRKSKITDLVITEEFKCKICGTRFHLLLTDYNRMAKQSLSVLCPRCKHVVKKGRDMYAEYKRGR